MGELVHTINELQDVIITEFAFFGDWMERYEYLIELGKGLPMIDERYKDDDHLIRGCQSRVWLQAEAQEDHIFFTADSDSVITRGIIALLVRVLSGQPAKGIAQANLYFIDRIGLREHLSPTRANGLLSMVKQMKYYALALDSKQSP